MSDASICAPTFTTEDIVNPEIITPNEPTNRLVAAWYGNQLGANLDNSAFFGGRTGGLFWNVSAGDAVPQANVTPSAKSMGTGPYSDDAAMIWYPTGTGQAVFDLETPPFGEDKGTVMFWIYKKTSAGNLPLLSPLSGIGFTFTTTGLSTLSLVSDDEFAQATASSAGGGFTINGWRHLAFTWNRTAGRQSIYLAGTRTDQDTPGTAGNELTLWRFGDTKESGLVDIRFYDSEIGDGGATITVPTELP